ncbi:MULTISPECIES: tRNA pseudouridine(55) synthase TruB [Candidatus Ichthyocystis]|uniref:tRNA pseudouridine(55) synthase TruB n=1 Tax=Candidatus Ichthyocystis TaxID=2929841 RepID=UPI000A79A37A|nr:MULTISPECIES: tRNA pseudouridine(55) synthase TruB [Ichthyocystis]
MINKFSSTTKSMDALDGVLLLNKPVGFTSNDAVQRVKHLFCAKKVGHTGTLDPLASGLMLICFGRCTKLFDTLVSSQKGYWARVILGEKRTTGDGEGEIEAVSSREPTFSEVEDAVYSFLGAIEQIPPAYSAIRIGGVRMYSLARRGVTVPRQRRTCTITGIALLGYSYPAIDIRVYCSKGTYIRTLAENIGASLGCCSYLGQLIRTMVGRYHVNDATHIRDIQELPLVQRRELLLLPSYRHPIGRTVLYPQST